MRLIVVAIASFFALYASARADEAPPMIGSKAATTFNIIGCRDTGDESRFVELMAAGDKQAALAFITDKGDSCTIIRAGEVASVEDTSVWHGQSCLRPTGKAYCFYVPSKAVVKR